MDETGNRASAEISRKADGKYAQRFDATWVAEYFEDPPTGLWRVEVFHRDVPEWTSVGYETLEDAARAARNYFDQR
ncbi:MAG: hypothetical protein GWO40_11665 [Gammaproteobacteria bacterium]|nr:hypothetical protein [Gammaproteobacteria bacterium]NIR89129.1 hypothetical protein [Gammaproteobacteria bacterium]NIU04931.1 hypothetical protein [Gammaproteobacteria bacterium]NIV52097.1 hypothetical protein [Gammaproteobacteria bacterium]NIV74286.1 hypothetical protein [Gammaproteobacteria bacterium]